MENLALGWGLPFNREFNMKKLLTIVTCSFLLGSCLNLPDPMEELNIELNEVSSSYNNIKVKATIDKNTFNGVQMTEFGLMLFLSSNYSNERTLINNATTTDKTTLSVVFNVESGDYIVQPYVKVGDNTYYGTTRSVYVQDNSSMRPHLYATTLSQVNATAISATSGVTTLNSVTEKGFCWSKTTAVPTIMQNKIAEGVNKTNFTSTISGLSEGRYYVRAYAINSYGVGYGDVASILLSAGHAPGSTATFSGFNPTGGVAGSSWTLKDERDNQTYKVVQMPDGRYWMGQNLNYTNSLTYNNYTNRANGAPYTTADMGGAPAIGSYWCNGATRLNTSMGPFTNQVQVGKAYGALYTWETAMMVDGRCTDDTKTSCGISAWNEYWVSGYYYNSNTGNATGSNARKNHGRGEGGRGICPLGWHVPTEYEWANMLDKVENTTAYTMQTGSGFLERNNGYGAGAKLKNRASCQSYSNDCNTDNLPYWNYDNIYSPQITDAYGFSIIPAGLRDYSGDGFFFRGEMAGFWASTTGSSDGGFIREFAVDDSGAGRVNAHRAYGASVRCIKNE